ncbi:MAG TPA: hypothetical protein PLR99_28265 [Polyangiaceae bacterium]|nr:hypothetical protein [Polyangiaceae bacterium]
MRSLKTFLFGGLLAGLFASAAVACAGSPVVEDDETPSGTGSDASATTKDGAPAASSSSPRDSSPPPPPTDSSPPPPPVDAGRDSTVGVDATPPPPPPPDASPTLPPLCDISDPAVTAKALFQSAINDKPPCDTTCRGCCYPVEFFCVK